MLETIVKINLALYALICLEGAALYWVMPRDPLPTWAKQHRRTRYFLVAGALFCLLMLFVMLLVPESHFGPSTLRRSQQVALLTPVTVACALILTVITVKRVRQRVFKWRRKSELERARLDRSKARRASRR